MSRLFTIKTPPNYNSSSSFVSILPGVTSHTRWPVSIGFYKGIFTKFSEDDSFPPVLEITIDSMTTGHTFRSGFGGERSEVHFVVLFETKVNNITAIYVAIPHHVIFSDFRSDINVSIHLGSIGKTSSLILYGYMKQIEQLYQDDKYIIK